MEHNRPIGFWLKLVDGLIDAQFEATLEEHGVTRRQWQIMNLLAERPATMAELEAELSPFSISGSEETLAEHLEELGESNWVLREREQFTLAELGRNSMTVLGEVVAENRDRAAEGIAPEDYERTVSALERMARNLGWDA